MFLGGFLVEDRVVSDERLRGEYHLSRGLVNAGRDLRLFGYERLPVTLCHVSNRRAVLRSVLWTFGDCAATGHHRAGSPLRDSARLFL